MLQRRMRNAIRRWEFFRSYNFTCCYCRVAFDEYTAMVMLEKDHKVPRAVLGDECEQPGNVIVACRTCNRKKGIKSYTEFMALLYPDDEPDWVRE